MPARTSIETQEGSLIGSPLDGGAEPGPQTPAPAVAVAALAAVQSPE